MAGLDDLLGSITKQAGGSGGGGLEDMLGGLLGGGGGKSSGAAAGGLGDVLGGLLGGGGSSGGTFGASGGGMNMGALVGALAPIVGGLLKGGGLTKMLEGAKTNGLAAEADSWVGTGDNASVSGQQVRGVVGDDAVKELAQKAGISEDQAADVLAKVVPKVVNGATPDGKVPAQGELDQLVAKFGG